jgi:hypothetical protein
MVFWAKALIALMAWGARFLKDLFVGKVKWREGEDH